MGKNDQNPIDLLGLDECGKIITALDKEVLSSFPYQAEDRIQIWLLTANDPESVDQNAAVNTVITAVKDYLNAHPRGQEVARASIISTQSESNLVINQRDQIYYTADEPKSEIEEIFPEDKLARLRHVPTPSEGKTSLPADIKPAAPKTGIRALKHIFWATKAICFGIPGKILTATYHALKATEHGIVAPMWRRNKPLFFSVAALPSLGIGYGFYSINHQPEIKLANAQILSIAQGTPSADIQLASYPALPAANGLAVKSVLCQPDSFDHYPPIYHNFLMNIEQQFGADSALFDLFKAFADQGILMKEELGGYVHPAVFYMMVDRETGMVDFHSMASGFKGPLQFGLERFYEEMHKNVEKTDIYNNWEKLEGIKHELSPALEQARSESLRKLDNTRKALEAYAGNAKYASDMAKNESRKIDLKISYEVGAFQESMRYDPVIAQVLYINFSQDKSLIVKPDANYNLDRTTLGNAFVNHYSGWFGGFAGGIQLRGMNDPAHPERAKMSIMGGEEERAELSKIFKGYPYLQRNVASLQNHWGTTMTKNHPFLKGAKTYRDAFNAIFEEEGTRIDTGLTVTHGTNAPNFERCVPIDNPAIIALQEESHRGKSLWQNATEPYHNSWPVQAGVSALTFVINEVSRPRDFYKGDRLPLEEISP